MRIDNLSTVAGDTGLLPSASFNAGSVPTLVQAYNQSAQSIPHNSTTNITGWTNQTEGTQNASEWNATTGVFTATKAGTYFCSLNVWFNSTVVALNTGFISSWTKNGTAVASGYYFVQDGASSVLRDIGVINAIISVVATDTIRCTAYQNSGGSITLSAFNYWNNTLNISELPGRITRL